METPDNTRYSEYNRGINVIDVVDTTEIWISPATLELKLRDLESAGRAAKYEDITPWVVSALTLVASAIPLYISSQEDWARTLAIVMATCALVPATLAFKAWRRARNDRDKRKVTAESILADILGSSRSGES